MEPAHVLLVEDSPGDALLMQQVLTNCSVPVRLHIARDAERALIKLADPRFKPSLIILDLNLPRTTGLRFLERYHPRNLPIVVFSASSREFDRERALALGAREYICKPFDLQVFTDAVCGMVKKWVVREKSDAITSQATI